MKRDGEGTRQPNLSLVCAIALTFFLTVSSFSEFLKLHKVRVTQEFPNLTMLPKSHAVRTTTIQITYCP